MMEIQTEKFQGPLGVMLGLIEQEELDITEISLAKIADEYLAYVQRSPDIGAAEMADFLLMAARLLFIKSKALLPYLITEEEEKEISDLENQLRMYKEFIEASLKIAEIISHKKILFSPIFVNKYARRFKTETPSFIAPKNLSPLVLQDNFLALIDRLRGNEEKLEEKKLEPKISIDERIDHIRKILSNKLRFSFSNFLKAAQSKTEIIVSFLAVLELAKQKELVFEQDELFSEIHIAWNDANINL